MVEAATGDELAVASGLPAGAALVEGAAGDELVAASGLPAGAASVEGAATDELVADSGLPAGAALVKGASGGELVAVSGLPGEAALVETTASSALAASAKKTKDPRHKTLRAHRLSRTSTTSVSIGLRMFPVFLEISQLSPQSPHNASPRPNDSFFVIRCSSHDISRPL